jgi:biotin operon repressor
MLLLDEIAIYRRLIYRDAEEYLCKKCLAADLNVEEAEIDRKIEHFRSIGCTLFI